jgi:2'-5' RNA ligase
MGKNKWISLNLPEEYRNKIFAISTSIREKLGEKFDQMDINMLHMTAVFLGDKFNKFELVTQVISQHNDTEFRLIFDEALTFPPEKQNLIVLKFKENNLKNVVSDIKNKLGIDEERFIAHITLGKLSLSKHDSNEFKNQIEEVLKNINEEEQPNFNSQGFYLCG